VTTAPRHDKGIESEPSFVFLVRCLVTRPEVRKRLLWTRRWIIFCRLIESN